MPEPGLLDPALKASHIRRDARYDDEVGTRERQRP